MASDPNSPAAARRCESGICGDTPALPLSFCANCDSFYCSTCWVLQGPHRPGKVGIDGLPHEKTDVEVVKNLKAILEPPSDPEALRKLHRRDEASTWFGVIRSEYQHPVTGKYLPEFKDFGRYATLMAESRPPNGSARYPQLVSFIGQTNAGKSTLVKMLISHEARKIGVPPSEFPSPVVGAARDDKVPTSGDVHLYADPETLQGQFPVLYADCEGLDGGEEEPISSQSRNQADSEAPKKSVFGGAKKRIIEWAKDDVTSGRAYAVEHLYPRLLYTFSDVVVFVLRNPKTFESVALKLLLDWAAASLEKSLNQPVLPHAIVVLNATDIQVSPDEWDVDKATRNLMLKVKNAVNQVAMFRHYAEIWRRKGKEIQSMEDLIKCYYSSIRVVRIPAKGRYMLIDGQIEKLHKQILLSCDAAFYTKERARMVSHVDELNEYLQAGFKHFSKRLDEPFNFVEIAVRNNPVPQNFGDHVSNLAAAMQRKDDYNDAVFIFETLSPFVASCLLLEVVRGRRPGSVEDLFDKYYSNMCKGALDRFCDMFWPCSYRDHVGRTCRNMKSGHATKGHQDQNGKILGQSKTYESSFSSSSYQKTWIGLIKKNLAICEKRLEQKRHSVGASQFKILEVQDAFQLHQQEQLKAFFEGRARNYSSMSTCYCCLMNVPQHPLPCGHVLCTDCVKNYGERLNYSSVGIASCPLHPEETRHLQRWVIRFKPDFAGVRVLSLDGGGIRGIIELEVLRAIEICLGGKIPIQRFFDLIVGTSTGGIIALGIGAKHWSVLTSMQKFTALCNQAFTPRELHEVHGIRVIVKLRHGSKYKTTPLHKALRTAFGEQYLFGGFQDSDTAYMTKVAVTTTSGTGQTPIIITNYGRQDDPQLPYRLEFSRGSHIGLKVWHAACATSAAPSIFKPFKHPETERSYMDGGLYYNNPVKIANHERRLLWPDVAENHPDIMLSIGTGQNLQETEAEMGSGTKSKSDAEKRKDARSYGKLGAREVKKLKSRRRQLFNTVKNVKNFFSVLVNRIDNILDSELAWREFFADLGDPADQERNTQQYIRINPDLQSQVPTLDAKDEMKDLQAYMVNELKTPSNQIMIRDVAHRLIASSFYFEKTTPKENLINENYTCSGVILCRFESGSLELREVGRYLKTKQTQDFQPYFIIEDQQDASFEKKIPFSPEMIIKIIDRAIFDSGTLHFRISSHLASTCISICLTGAELSEPKRYPISGFPRTLVTEDSLKEARLERQRTQARARRPGIRNTVSEATVAPNETEKPQQHSLSDSVIPTFMQRIKQQELNRSFTFNQKYPNLLDEDARTSKTQAENLISFPALTPTKSESDKSRSEVSETFSPPQSPPSSRGKGKSSSLSSIADSKRST